MGGLPLLLPPLLLWSCLLWSCLLSAVDGTFDFFVHNMDPQGTRERGGRAGDTTQ